MQPWGRPLGRAELGLLKIELSISLNETEALRVAKNKAEERIGLFIEMDEIENAEFLRRVRRYNMGVESLWTGPAALTSPSIRG